MFRIHATAVLLGSLFSIVAVRVPNNPVVPSPKVDSKSVIVLTEELVFCVDSDTECVLLCSPEGRLKFTAEKGPISVRGKFVDGNGKVERREFKGPFLYWVEPIEDGTCELIIFEKATGEVTRRTIEVKAGKAPQPPPKPDTIDPPKPKPDPVSSFRVIFVYESENTLTQAQKNVIFGKVVESYLDSKTTPENGHPGWRRYDKDGAGVNEQRTMRTLWQAVKPTLTNVPCVAIEVNGKVTLENLPPTPQAAVALFDKHLGK